MESQALDMDRRRFIKVGFLAGAGLFVAMHVPDAVLAGDKGNYPLIDENETLEPNAWIRIRPDDTVTVMIHHSEMGQGIMTGLSMIVAEELDADWSKVRAEHAPVAKVYRNPEFGIQATGGSTSVTTSWDILREAGAAAREMFVSAAAQTWGAPKSACKTKNSTVVHQSSGKTLRYGELLKKAASQPVPKKPRLKDPKSFGIVGQRKPRLDTQAKIRGEAVFGIDVTTKGLLAATVVHPPTIGAEVQSVNDKKAASMPGVRNILPIESGVAVVADTVRQAFSAAEELEISWKNGISPLPDTEKIMKSWAERIKDGGKDVRDDGEFEKAFAGASKKIEAYYELPYQYHACPEPMNCTADVRKDGCDVWAPTQAQEVARETAVRITGLNPDSVRVHTPFMGGGFGRRGASDYVEEAVTVSKAVKSPVKVVWTREEDVRSDWFRPAFYNFVQAGLDDKGMPVAWLHRGIGPAQMAETIRQAAPCIVPQWLPRPIKYAAAGVAAKVVSHFTVPEETMSGSATMAYDIENIRVEYIEDDPGVQVGAWRSVGNSRNAFVVESFMDEIAAASGKDPLELRLALLKNALKRKGVLELAADKAGWGKPLPDGIHRGLAVHQFHDTPAAMIAEISVDDRGNVRVRRIVAAVDCGTVINPRLVEAQMIGGVAFGLSATLKSRITIKDGRVEQSNFHDFPILRMDEMPKVEVHIVKSSAHPTGIGEVPVPPVAPAVTNAIFAATGKRIRKIPVDPVEIRAS